MLKRIVSILLLLISLLFIVLFDLEVYNLFILVPLIYSIVFILFLHRKNKNKKYNILLLVLSIIAVGYIIFDMIVYIRSNASFNEILLSNSFYLNIILFCLYLLILINIFDIKKDMNKTSFILNIIISITVLFIYVRYNVDSHFEIRILNNYSGNDLMQVSERYIYQNYPYMLVMYIGLLINNLINKKD